MTAAVAVDLPLSTPCLDKRHPRCQLGVAGCACACHSPEGLKVERPAVEKCKTLHEALKQWFAAIDGAYIIRDEVDAFATYMRVANRVRWHEWLDAVSGDALTRIVQSDSKGGAMRMGRDPISPRSVFSDAAEKFGEGDMKAMDHLSVPYVVSADNTRNVLANLTHDELTVPIQAYVKRAESNALEAAYLRAVQKKLPKDNSKTVGEVLTNAQLQTLRDSFQSD